MARRLAGPDLLAMAGLAAWTVFLLAEALIGGWVFFERDVHAYWHPLMTALRRSAAGDGWPPLWIREVGFGAPGLADPNLQPLYPLTWAILWVPPLAYYTAFVALHCLGTGIGAYRLGRIWSLDRLPALVAGAAWCSSGAFLSAANLFHHYAGAAWIPWVLWALERALRSPTGRAITVLGLMAAGQLLAGSADMCLFTALAGAARGLSYVWSGCERWPAARTLLVVAGSSGLLALLLAGVQWIPTAALVATSARTGHDLRTITYWSLHPASLVDFVVPNLVSGFPWAEAPRQALFEGRGPLLACLYFGPVMATLAALGLVAPGARRARLLLGLTALFLLAAVGRFTPFQYLLALPPLGMLRYATKYTLPAILCAALLAGFGAQVWLAEWQESLRRRALYLLAIVVTAVLLCMAGAAWITSLPRELRDAAEEGAAAAGVAMSVKRLMHGAGAGAVAGVLLWLRCRTPNAPGWLTAAFILLALLDVGSVTRRANTLMPRGLLHQRPALAEALKEGDRVFAAPADVGTLRRGMGPLPAGWDGAWAWALGFRQRLAAPSSAVWGLRGSYDGDFTGLAPSGMSYLSVTASVYRDQPIGLKLLRMGGVRAVATVDTMESLPLLAERSSVFRFPVRLYAVPDPLPMAYWVGRASVAAEPASYVTILHPRFVLDREVVLAPPAPQLAARGTSGVVTPIAATAEHLVFETDADGPGYLVVVEAFDSGWRARVDGQAAPVYRANILFRAVPVPPGRHSVELRYRPPSVAWGLASSGVGALAVLVLIGRGAVSPLRRAAASPAARRGETSM